MTTQALTPYDTGDRLEPHPWVKKHTRAAPWETVEDDYGRVDFEDDEGSTVVSLYVGRTDDGSHELHVENFSPEALAVTGDLASVVIGPDHLAGVLELLALAERGRQDYQHQAQFGDYSQSDQDEATLRWVNAHNAALAIRQQIHSTPHN